MLNRTDFRHAQALSVYVRYIYTVTIKAGFGRNNFGRAACAYLIWDLTSLKALEVVINKEKFDYITRTDKAKFRTSLLHKLEQLL